MSECAEDDACCACRESGYETICEACCGDDPCCNCDTQGKDCGACHCDPHDTCCGCHADCEVHRHSDGDEQGLCHHGCDMSVCVPTIDEMRYICPEPMSSCEDDTACAGEVTDALAIWPTQGPPQPGGDLFNNVSLCFMLHTQHPCGGAVHSCWLDSGCASVMNDHDPTDAVLASLDSSAAALYEDIESCHCAADQ